MAYKDFKTIDEQLEILCSRGLKIGDTAKAKDFLLRNNYYRISGYSLTLRDNDVFQQSSTFQDIIDIYNFDHQLRHIILKYLEIIEVQFKSIYAYEFTKKHGAVGHLDASFFTDSNTYNKILDKVNNQKIVRLSQEAYLKHFIEELQEEIPFWAYIDLFSFSDISILYSISEKEIKKAVANWSAPRQTDSEIKKIRF